jgi:thiosulfate dehydrogenase [quinone] large subunit
MDRQLRSVEKGNASFRDPAIVQNLLGDVRFAPVWLVLRVAVGWFWLDAGWLRLHDRVTGAGISGAADLLPTGLTLCGIALILGVLTGPTAFAGGGLSVVAADVVAVQPGAVVFAAVVWLILAWKTAGWIGIDRWLLPLLGMPWRGGALFGDRTEDWRANRMRRQTWTEKRPSS